MRFGCGAVIGILAALLLVGSFQTKAHAESVEPKRERMNRTIESSSPQDVVEGIAGKAVRGVTNVATGWMELPKQVQLTIKEEGYARGLTVGTVKGMGMMLVRTVVGVAEAATCVVAYPGFYDPYIEPVYVWDKE